MNMKVTHVEIRVGTLPEWYNEAEHNYQLESGIKETWSEQFEGAEITVVYNYSGQHMLAAWSENGDLVSEIPVSLDYAFSQIIR